MLGTVWTEPHKGSSLYDLRLAVMAQAKDCRRHREAHGQLIALTQRTGNPDAPTNLLLRGRLEDYDFERIAHVNA